MTVTHLGNNRYEGLTADTKPTNVPAGSIYRDTQLDIDYEFNGTTWDAISSGGGISASSTDTLINKSVNISNNTVTATSRATGDIIKDNGTKYERFARGTSLQVLRVNTGGTDLEWAAAGAGGGDVTLTGIQTLTNKSLTAPVMTSYVDYTRTTLPSNPAANFGRVYVKQIDANNDGLFILLKKAGAYVEVQVG